jgi:hypothetical protein
MMTEDKVEAVEEVIKPLKGFIDVDPNLPWYVPIRLPVQPKKQRKTDQLALL